MDSENDELNITPLGAGQEVGRSCIMMEFKGKKIMLDCGIHPGLTGMDALPFIDMIEVEDIDLLLVSHFHLDHCGALPWFLTKTAFKGRCFMTHATKAIYRCLLADCIKVSTDQILYTEADLESSMDKIETINFHEEKEVNGIKFWCYNAGHVLGASMFMIEIAGVKTLYTGDFSRQEDRHLMSAEIPSIKPEVLIIESTYGTHIHEKREEREARFTGIVHDTVLRGGRCLIPVFALGRAQELLLILDEYWSQHPELHDIPIYYASLLAKKCMAVYQTYINAMNDKIKKQISINNPFVFKHISNLKSIDHFDDCGPCVIMATPGMMQSGLSRELFEAWCPDARNTCIIAGYCVEGTLAKQILAEPEEILTLSGTKVPRKCQIEYISFSAHTDYYQTSEFVRTLRPPHIVLVHGESNEMGRLKAAINREYEDDLNAPVLHNPKNTQTVKLHFRGEKTAKVSWLNKNYCKRQLMKSLLTSKLSSSGFTELKLDDKLSNFLVENDEDLLDLLNIFLSKNSNYIERISSGVSLKKRKNDHYEENNLDELTKNFSVLSENNSSDSDETSSSSSSESDSNNSFCLVKLDDSQMEKDTNQFKDNLSFVDNNRDNERNRFIDDDYPQDEEIDDFRCENLDYYYDE